MKYEVIRDCYGFLGKYWVQGDIVELEDSDQPPEHFAPIVTEAAPGEGDFVSDSGEARPDRKRKRSAGQSSAQ